MASQPVRVITSAGQYKLISKDAIKVIGDDSATELIGGSPIVVYPVPASEIGDYNLIQGEPIHVTEAPVSRGQDSSRWAYPVYHVGPGTWPPSSGPSLDPDYLVYEGAMAVAPSGAWRTAANQLFISWKAALGVDVLADAMDIAYIFAAETEQAALLNMVKRAHDCTNVNSVAFEADRGVTGNGSTSYLNTNYNPGTQGVNFILDSASIGIYSRTNSANNDKSDIGVEESASASKLQLRLGAGQIRKQLNQSTSTVTINIPNSTSLIVADRSSSTQTHAYQSGALLGNEAHNSVAVPNFDVAICGVTYEGVVDTFSDRQYSCAFIGRSLTSQEHEGTYNAWQTFLTAIGAQV